MTTDRLPGVDLISVSAARIKIGLFYPIPLLPEVREPFLGGLIRAAKYLRPFSASRSANAAFWHLLRPSYLRSNGPTLARHLRTYHVFMRH